MPLKQIKTNHILSSVNTLGILCAAIKTIELNKMLPEKTNFKFTLNKTRLEKANSQLYFYFSKPTVVTLPSSAILSLSSCSTSSMYHTLMTPSKDSAATMGGLTGHAPIHFIGEPLPASSFFKLLVAMLNTYKRNSIVYGQCNMKQMTP